MNEKIKNKSCQNCWFFCHSNGRCYVDERSAYNEEYAMQVVMATACTDWADDGLEDWEREPAAALMTMEEA